ncbi:tyrosine-type recombinase/integrase [Photobacterium damselae]|uniref:tyrosine-type recombinase/integrase n=1 Tax=Photobacterium damselae TaxID=38293 RepID=UPI0021750B64|nr:tyrosine-type recombinase/integrase [Photobacterium damselae]
MQELKATSENCDYVLGELKQPEAVSQKGRMLWKQLGHVENRTLHDLRRTFATRLNDLGVAIHVVEQLLGHTLGGVIAIYNRSLYLPEKSKALSQWVEQLELLSIDDRRVGPSKKSRITIHTQA